jgi:aryl-alcohol dehydrogenase-like predicted oxidoreductase
MTLQIKPLGRSGLKVSNLCLGTMTFGNQTDKQESFSILDQAFDKGIYFLDTANAYPLGASFSQAGATEEIIGEWIQRKRDKLVVATKCLAPMGPGPFERGLSRKHIMSAIEDSLRRMRTDYVDLYMAHAFDDTVPLEETLNAFDDIVTQGKARYIGISNWRSWQIAKALGIAERKHYVQPIGAQLRYNLLFRAIEDDTIPMCISEDIGVVTYNPLAGGMLTGRYKSGQEPEKGTRFDVGKDLYKNRYWNNAIFDAVENYTAGCRERGYDPVTTAIRWVLQQPGITSVIIGASRAEQLASSLAAVQVEPLNMDDLKWLDGLWYTLPRQQGGPHN